MRNYTIDLDQNVVTYIERLNYEYEALKDNVAFMIHHFSNDDKFMKCDLFREYQHNEIMAKINLEHGMHEVYEKYVPDKFKGHRMSWIIDFKKNVIIVTLYCDCEV